MERPNQLNPDDPTIAILDLGLGDIEGIIGGLTEVNVRNERARDYHITSPGLNCGVKTMRKS